MSEQEKSLFVGVRIGTPVKDIAYGEGVVITNTGNEIAVDFNNDLVSIKWYTIDGKYIDGAQYPTLTILNSEREENGANM